MPMASLPLYARKPRVKDNRLSASKRGYGRTWRRFRLMMIARYPVCQDCNRLPTTEIHHIIKKRDGGADSDENTLKLCHDCHSVRTGKGE